MSEIVWFRHGQDIELIDRPYGWDKWNGFHETHGKPLCPTAAMLKFAALETHLANCTHEHCQARRAEQTDGS